MGWVHQRARLAKKDRAHDGGFLVPGGTRPVLQSGWSISQSNTRFSEAMQKSVNRMATSCLFDESTNGRYFRDLSVVYIACGRWPWHTIWAAHRIKEIHNGCILRRIRPRPMEFVVIPDGNHFVSMAYGDTAKRLMPIIFASI